MRILIACEESQRVCTEFRRLGHEATDIVDPILVEYICKNGKKVIFDEYMVRGIKGDRAKHRSKTFPGIAKAMAEQWGGG